MKSKTPELEEDGETVHQLEEDGETVRQLEIQCEDQMWDVMNAIQADRADKFHEFTHLKIVINSTNFGDWDDDLW